MNSIRLLFILLLLCLTLASSAQKATVSGKVIDNFTNEPVPGATVTLTLEYRSKSDFDGIYSISSVPFGKYKMVVAMLSFDTISYEIYVDEEDFVFDVLLSGSQELAEVEVIANIAIDRKTPVAVTTLGKKEIAEELGS